jgi:protein-S-isoprenylcysteine O-methyltransferase Ste14
LNAPVNSTETTVFYTVYSLWFLSEVIGAWMIPRLRGPRSPGTVQDRGSGGLIFGTVFFSIFVAFALSSADITPLPDWVFYPGIVMMLVGIVVRQWAIAVLGRFFSLTVRVQTDHRVVDKGPYRLLRHPSYTGAILSLLGLTLALETWAATLVLGVVFGVAYGYRIHVEEKTLAKELGSEYTDYMKRTKRLIPFLF